MYSLFQSHAKSTQSQTSRRFLRMESLENRVMLSGTPPKVTAVSLGSTQWSSTFVEYIESTGQGAGGYSIPTGSNQLKPLSWTDLNQIHITFDQNVQIAAGDLSVSGTAVTAYAFNTFNYDSGTYTATWTLATALAKDKILLSLDANGKYPVHNSDGQVLDGAWTNGTSSFPSGNGNEGDDFKFQVNILPGDTDGNNSINVFDLAVIRGNLGKIAGDTGYYVRYDIDGDGSITSTDYNLVYARGGNVLPTGTPAGLSNNAPTAMPLGNLGVETNAVDTVFRLGDIFGDVEDATANLAFSITNNTNSNLFDSLSISQGRLTLSYAANTEGTAALTLRATDNGGLIVETTMNVTVADTQIWVPFDNPPVISDFTGIPEPGGVWTFSGTVSDPDQDVAGMIITFGGILEDFNYIAIVQLDGTFEITESYPGLYSGTATALTFDMLGMASNFATFYVTV